MRFILDALGVGGAGSFDGTAFSLPGKAVYRSPSGQTILFDYEDLSSSIELKTTPFENAVGNGTYVQDNGHTSGRFPMNAIFHGDGYLDKAEAFLSAVLEPGVGVLTHPAYRKDINVVPVGEVIRSDAFKSAANQVIFTLSFFETTGLQIGDDPGLDQLYDSFLDASAVDFDSKLNLDEAVDRDSFAKKVQKAIASIEQGLKAASQGIAGATNLIEGAGDSINRGIDLLVGQPLALARQTQIMIGEPRRQNTGIKAKLQGYSDLANDIFTGIAAEPSKYSNDKSNTFQMNNMTAQALVVNYAMLAADDNEYFSKADYILAAEALNALFLALQTWYDAQYAALASTTVSADTVDTGGGMAELLGLINAAMSSLVTASFNAKTQMSKILDSDFTPIDLCYELYGSAVGDTLDLFYQANKLGGDEYFLIEKGREIVWYV